MILARLLNGWPDRITSKDHVGAVPDGFISFVDIPDMDRWKAANTALVPPVKTPPEPVPSEVPLWAFRAVLTVMGIAPRVDGMLNALSEPQRTVAQTQWVYGNYILRDHPLIQALGSQIGLTNAQIDEVFLKASTLS